MNPCLVMIAVNMPLFSHRHIKCHILEVIIVFASNNETNQVHPPSKTHKNKKKKTKWLRNREKGVVAVPK